MIDIENEIFSTVSKSVKKKYPKAFITGEYVKSPSSFPCISLAEIENIVYEKTQTSQNAENHAMLIYEVNVYSNKVKSKKAECKTIISIIDSEFLKLGFTRTMLTPIPNETDATIYRMVARYRVYVSKDKILYRR